MAKEETNISRSWLLKWTKWAILFRNQIGAAWAGTVIRQWEEEGEKFVTLKKAYRLPFGLFKGSGDYIGWRTVVVTPDMVGKKVAIFTSVEFKTDEGRVEDDQRIWLMNVRRAGGIAMVVRDPEQKPCEWEGVS